MRTGTSSLPLILQLDDVDVVFQEEIRFSICPELLVSCIITERMDVNEAVRIVGAQRFSDYSGYAETFQWHARSPVAVDEPRCAFELTV